MSRALAGRPLAVASGGSATVVSAMLAGLVILRAPPVSAERCADEAAALRAHLEVEAGRARRWNTAWAIAFGAFAVGQGVLAVTETKPFGTFDRDYEEALYVGAAKAMIGTAARLVLPLRVRVPAASSDPCADLPRVREALADAGRRERSTFLLTHLGGLALNLSGAALLAYRRSFAVGAASFALALPVAPIAAYTQPRRSWRRWREERASWSVGVTASANGAIVWLAL